jgi:hypothetical protein
MLGHVHHPQAVRLHRVEHPIDQVLGRLGGGVAAGAASPPSPIDAGDELGASAAPPACDHTGRPRPSGARRAPAATHTTRDWPGGCRRSCWSGRRRPSHGPRPAGHARRRTRTWTPSSRDNTSPPAGPGSPAR